MNLTPCDFSPQIAVGRKVTIKDHRKNDASTIIHIEERPMQCALCKVKSNQSHTSLEHGQFIKICTTNNQEKKDKKL